MKTNTLNSWSQSAFAGKLRNGMTGVGAMKETEHPSGFENEN